MTCIYYLSRKEIVAVKRKLLPLPLVVTISKSRAIFVVALYDNIIMVCLVEQGCYCPNSVGSTAFVCAMIPSGSAFRFDASIC